MTRDGTRYAALRALRRRFDSRLSGLRAREAGDRLRTVMRHGAKLGGQVRAGKQTPRIAIDQA